jgi:hypothetical protein
MIPPEIEALLAQTLLGGYEDDEPLAAVGALRLNGSVRLCRRVVSVGGGAQESASGGHTLPVPATLRESSQTGVEVPR